MVLNLAKKYGLESYEDGTTNVQWQRGWRTGVGGAFVSIYEPPGQLWTPEWLLALPEERLGSRKDFLFFQNFTRCVHRNEIRAFPERPFPLFRVEGVMLLELTMKICNKMVNHEYYLKKCLEVNKENLSQESVGYIQMLLLNVMDNFRVADFAGRALAVTATQGLLFYRR
ncbi:hypothetical protein CDAR_562591 [Caerostris darwini]|uniref:Uncharacterized protein n=1 Tax=Caerostris darwini TaxID=1538125 RepID=A0AAV4X9V8_9ARAC|nr:hypothetical protein CDAR_562591 [Caerostris darwini]